MLASICLLAGSLLSIVASATLLCKSEAVRGAGRIVLGLAWTVIGLSVWAIAPDLPAAVGITHGAAVLLVISALVTLGSGVRKYLRRNLPAS